MKLRFFCIMFALVLVLCACGGAEDGAVTTEPPVTEVPIPAGPPVVLNGYTLIRSENAERAVQQAQSKIKDVECKVLPFKGGKHMVTIFGSDSVADCNAFARSYRDVYPDLWVYNKK